MAEYKMNRGDSLELFMTVAVPSRPPQPVDISNTKIWMTAKRTLDDEDVDAVFQISTLTGDIVVTDGPAGELTVLVPASATAGLTQDERLYYDIQLRSTTGIVLTLERGVLIIERDVTRAIA